MFSKWFNAVLRREMGLVLGTIAIAGLLNYAIIADTAFLNFYNLTVVVAAFFLGRRAAVLSAMLSILIVVLLALVGRDFLGGAAASALYRIISLAAWGSFLVITAYLTGTLCEKRERATQELRETYYGILQILMAFMGNDKYTQNHCYRVSVYAMRLGAQLGLSNQQLEDLRAAALVHDVGKLRVSREVLYKASRLTEDEYAELKSHLTKGFEVLQPISKGLRRVVEIVLAHHDKFDGTGYRPHAGLDIPMEARILSCVDVYDSLISDRPYRKALDPFRAKEIIVEGAGKDFDPIVVRAFERVFAHGDMDMPETVNPIGDEILSFPASPHDRGDK